MRERGSDVGAVDVIIAQEDARRHQGGLGWGARVWSCVLDATIGYGYRPMRALWWILFFVALGSVLFGLGYHERAITPTEPDAYDAFVKTGEPPRHYPPFNAVVYSLENFLPVVDLHQGNVLETQPAPWDGRPDARALGHAPPMVPVDAYSRGMDNHATARRGALGPGAPD